MFFHFKAFCFANVVDHHLLWLGKVDEGVEFNGWKIRQKSAPPLFNLIDRLTRDRKEGQARK